MGRMELVGLLLGGSTVWYSMWGKWPLLQNYTTQSLPKSLALVLLRSTMQGQVG